MKCLTTLNFRLFVLFIFLSSYQAIAQQDQLFTREIGIAPFTFRHSFPHGVAATLDTIRDLGFTMIEGGGGDMDSEVYKRLCEERGLRIPATGGDYHQMLENPGPTIERAKVYGSEYVVVFWIPHQTGKFSLEDAQRAARDFNVIGKRLRESGLKFAYHAHGFEFQPHGTGTLLDYLMENTDPEHVFFEMDIFWIQFGGGDPVALLEKYPDRWKLMHLKDMQKGIEKNLTGGTNHEFNVALGDGQIDIEGVIRTALDIGVEYFFIEDESSRIGTQLARSIAYLESLRK